MKLIMAIVNEDRVTDILNALTSNDIRGITVSDTRGFGNMQLSGEADDLKLNKKVKLEIVVSGENYKNLAIDLITENAHELNKGAGKIFVLPVEEVYRIRTGERDAEALK